MSSLDDTAARSLTTPGVASPLSSSSSLLSTTASTAAAPAAAYLTCPTCGKKCHPTNLSRHLVTHTGLRRYDCPHCDAAFTTSTNLKRHVNHFHERKDTSAQELASNHRTHQTSEQQPVDASRHIEAEDRTSEGPELLSASGAGTVVGYGEASCESSMPGSAIRHDCVSTAVAADQRPPCSTAASTPEPEHAALHPQPCAFGCGKEFVWPSTRKAHEAVCRRRRNAESKETSGGGGDGKAAVARPAPFICRDCEAVLSSASKLHRHALYHCPFRLDGALGPQDDAGSPVSFGAEALFPFVPIVSADEVLTVPVTTAGDKKKTNSERQNDARRHKPLLFICPHCSDAFQKERHLSAHLARRHATPEASRPDLAMGAVVHSATRTVAATVEPASESSNVRLDNEIRPPPFTHHPLDDRKRRRAAPQEEEAAAPFSDQPREDDVVEEEENQYSCAL